MTTPEQILAFLNAMHNEDLPELSCYNAELVEDTKRGFEAYERAAWQPIESAPKDGTMLLIMLPRMMNLVVRAWYDTVHKQWLCDYGSEGGITRLYIFHKGDLWARIPTPPQEASNG